MVPRKSRQELEARQGAAESDVAPFTGLVVEEVNAEPERKAARPSVVRKSKAQGVHASKTRVAEAGAEAVNSKPESRGKSRKASQRPHVPEDSQSEAADARKAEVAEAIPNEDVAGKGKNEVRPEARGKSDERDEQVGERLQKLLARAGVASRRRAEELIAEGRVQVNGQVVTEPGTRALLGRDHVRVDGKLVQAAERMRYFLLNKPKGYVTTVSDPEGRPTVMEFFPGVRERVYPVGRLDYLSEGLLLVTNDGPLANGLTRAASGVEKRYLVKVAGEPDEAMLESLRTGVVIERGRPGSGEGRVRTAPAEIRKVRQGENPWFEVVLIEGRNRELRKMFEEIGHHVEKIRRIGYGPLELDVEPGKVRELAEDELRLLRLAAEGKWKPKRRREPVALPKEAGRSVRHASGTNDGRRFATRAAERPGQRPGQRPAQRPGLGAGLGTGQRGAERPMQGSRSAWKDRAGGPMNVGRGAERRSGPTASREAAPRQERPRWSERRTPDGDGRSERRDRATWTERPGARPERRPVGRNSRPELAARPGRGTEGGRPAPSGRSARGERFERPGQDGRGERTEGSSRSGGFARPAGTGRVTGRPGTKKSFARQGFATPDSAGPDSAGQRYPKPGFSRPGFAKSGTRPQRSTGRWRPEEEKPQPGGRNSVPKQRVGPDGKPREKKRWRDSFEGKSKGKPKWASKHIDKPKSKKSDRKSE